MSYWIYLEIDTGGSNYVNVLEQNYTSNVSPMWTKALGRPLADFHGAPASEAAGPLDAAVRKMEASPDTYRAMNPPNGWGIYEGALGILRNLRDACRDHPKTTIRISH
jgi:hypothetical protein